MVGATGGVGVMALTREQVHAWLVDSCEAQGVPVTIEDPALVRDVVVLLTGRSGGSGAKRGASRRSRSESPDGLNPVEVNRLGA